MTFLVAKSYTSKCTGVGGNVWMTEGNSTLSGRSCNPSGPRLTYACRTGFVPRTPASELVVPYYSCSLRTLSRDGPLQQEYGPCWSNSPPQVNMTLTQCHDPEQGCPRPHFRPVARGLFYKRWAELSPKSFQGKFRVSGTGPRYPEEDGAQVQRKHSMFLRLDKG